MKKLYLLFILQLTFLSSLHAMESGVGIPDEAARRAFEAYQEELRQKKIASSYGVLLGIKQVALQDYLAQNTSYATSMKSGSHAGVEQGTGTITADIIITAYKDFKALVSHKDALEQDVEATSLQLKFAELNLQKIQTINAVKQFAQSSVKTEQGKNNPELEAIIKGAEAQNIQLVVEIYNKMISKPSTLEKVARFAIPTAAAAIAVGTIGSVVYKLATGVPIVLIAPAG